ncbi:MAG: methylcobalamin:coenzyme M methyltransferase [candidate division BRC1 bacterium ADurb.BinA364]|nr:MAG: methylcobalamin:coenzyme M methyltransferase [candidate division BRC1 bacterium ADurb.BinA364]
MNNKQRMEAALRGDPVDRPPIWLREGFDFIHGPHRWLGWQADPIYRELWEFACPWCATVEGWSAGSHFNRFLGIPPDRIKSRVVAMPDGSVRNHGEIDTPKGKLHFLTERRPGENTSWTLKHAVETMSELEMLRSVPWELAPVSLESYHRAKERVGDQGVLRMGLSSPIVCISGAMNFEMFLELAGTEKALFHELLEEITRRFLFAVEAIFASGPLETTANLGGSEQCTPPMMRPEAFDEYVIPYDGKLVQALRRHGVCVNMHCHGKIRHALRCMREMGLDSTDPVEPPPGGDLSIAEAREIAGDRLTLIGNLQFGELEYAEPERIRRRVREILATGERRLVLAASAGPISRVSSRLAANIRAWIETALE